MRQPVLLRQPGRCPRCSTSLATEPTLLLARAGPAAEQVARRPRRRRCVAARCARCALPLLAQTDFDHLLWSCELNFVRGEDSLVRAIWAGAPFVWQAYVAGRRRPRRQARGLPRPLPAGRRRHSPPRARACSPPGTAPARPLAAPACPIDPRAAWQTHCAALARRDCADAGGPRDPRCFDFVASKALEFEALRSAGNQPHRAAFRVVRRPHHRNSTMKIAQEIRAGNVIMQGKDPMVVLAPNTAAAAATRPPCA